MAALTILPPQCFLVSELAPLLSPSGMHSWVRRHIVCRTLWSQEGCRQLCPQVTPVDVFCSSGQLPFLGDLLPVLTGLPLDQINKIMEEDALSGADDEYDALEEQHHPFDPLGPLFFGLGCMALLGVFGAGSTVVRDLCSVGKQ